MTAKVQIGRIARALMEEIGRGVKLASFFHTTP
jgi:hypothetical protein